MPMQGNFFLFNDYKQTGFKIDSQKKLGYFPINGNIVVVTKNIQALTDHILGAAVVSIDSGWGGSPGRPVDRRAQLRVGALGVVAQHAQHVAEVTVSRELQLPSTGTFLTHLTIDIFHFLLFY